MKIHYYNISTALLIFGLIGGCKPGSVPADTSEAYDIVLSKSTIYESRVSNEISVWTPYQIIAELPKYEIKERGHCWSSKSPQPTLADRSAQANDKSRASVLRGISLDSTYYIEPYFILNNGKVVYGRDLKQKTLVFRRKTCDVITEKPALSEISFPAQINYLGWIISFWTNNETLYALNIVGDCWSYDRTYRQWNLVAKLPFETKKGVWQYLSDFEGFASNGQSYAVLTKILDQSGTVNSVRADSVQLWKLNESKKEWVKLATLVQPVEKSTFIYEKSNKLYFMRSYSPLTDSKVDEYDIVNNRWKSDALQISIPVYYSRQRIENALYEVRNNIYASGRGAIVERNIDTGAERNLELETVCSSPIIQYGGYCLALGDKLWVGGTYLENFNPDNPYKHVFIHGLSRWFSPKTNQWSTITFDIADLITLNTLDVDYPQGFGDGKRLYFVSKSRQKIWEWEPK